VEGDGGIEHTLCQKLAAALTALREEALTLQVRYVFINLMHPGQIHSAVGRNQAHRGILLTDLILQ
jgi:hypothetical protein